MTAYLVTLPAAFLAAISGTLEDPDRGKENWDGSIEFSAAAASGNTENTVLGARFSARRVFGRYRHDLAAGANYARSTTEDDAGVEIDRETQNNWFGQYRLEVETGDRTFLYGRVRQERDVFSGFDSRSFVGVGAGHEILTQKGLTWQVIAGPGVRHTEFVEPDVPTADFDDSETEVALFAGSEFDWLIRENVEFAHDLDATVTEANTTIDTEASIKTKITETLSTRLSYHVKHETDPAEDREATDTQINASIVFGF